MSGPEYTLESPVEAAQIPEVRNHTPFPSQYFQMMDTNDKIFHVLVSRLTFDLMKLDRLGAPELAPEQSPLVFADEFYQQPNTSAIIQESDFAPYKPRCDILFAHATAYAPKEASLARWPVGVRIGHWSKKITVCGPRRIVPAALGWKLQAPQPAIQVPLRYELAFGGTLQWPESVAENEEPEILIRHPTNPIGCGLLDAAWLKKVRPHEMRAPQMEVFDQALDEAHLHKKDYPVIGLGAIGRWWAPRIRLAGSYDRQWQEERWPRLPRDFDSAYWNYAPEDQQIDYPQGGEEIVLAGLTPGGGPFKTRIPAPPPHALVRLYAGPILPRRMNLDTLIFDMHRMHLSCVYRMTVAADADVRVLEIRRREA